VHLALATTLLFVATALFGDRFVDQLSSSGLRFAETPRSACLGRARR
jgi:hypothetical protein